MSSSVVYDHSVGFRVTVTPHSTGSWPSVPPHYKKVQEGIISGYGEDALPLSSAKQWNSQQTGGMGRYANSRRCYRASCGLGPVLVSLKCQRLAPNWGQSQVYLWVGFFFPPLVTSLSSAQLLCWRTFTSLWCSDAQGNLTHSHLNLSLVSDSLTIQAQHELPHNVVAYFFSALAIRTSQRGKSVVIEKRTLILVVLDLPAPCHLLDQSSSSTAKLTGAVLLSIKMNSLQCVPRVPK